MDSIKLFLTKFKNYLPPAIALQRLAREVIKQETGIDLKAEEIKLTNFTLYIKTRPAAKSEIFLKREKILERLGEKLKLI